jgi:hypothetical protein
MLATEEDVDACSRADSSSYPLIEQELLLPGLLHEEVAVVVSPARESIEVQKHRDRLLRFPPLGLVIVLQQGFLSMVIWMGERRHCTMCCVSRTDCFLHRRDLALKLVKVCTLVAIQDHRLHLHP